MASSRNNSKKDVRVRQVPNNYEAEQSLLGAMLLDNEVANEVIGEIKMSDFYYESHRLIFEAISDLLMANQPVDIVTLTDKLGKEALSKIGGVMYINEIMNILPSTANFREYCDIVKRDGRLRTIIRNAERIVENTYDADDENKALSFAEKMIYSISEEGESSELAPVKESALQVMKKFQDILSNPDANKGLLTYFKNLDEITHGYQPGQLIVLAARPGCGKTTFAMNIVGNIAMRDPEKKIAVFNLEMNRNEVSERLMVGMAKVKLESMLTAKGTKEDYRKLWEVNQILADSNVYLDDTAKITAEQIMSKCRRLAQKKGGLDLVVIDYLQLLESSDSKRTNDSKQQQVADISRAMKIMAKELKVPVILLSQMSRDVEKRDDKTPKLSDLRESGAIEQDADQVYFLSRPDNKDNEVDNKFVDLIIAKHRSGATGTIYFKFENEMLKFIPAQEKSKYIERNNEDKEDDAENETVSSETEIENSADNMVESGLTAEMIDSMAGREDDSDFDISSMISELNSGADMSKAGSFGNGNEEF